MLRLVPVKKLSTQTTSPPRSSRRSHRCEPRNPAPPVTSMRFSRCILWSVHPRAASRRRSLPSAYLPHIGRIRLGGQAAALSVEQVRELRKRGDREVHRLAWCSFAATLTPLVGARHKGGAQAAFRGTEEIVGVRGDHHAGG